MNNTNNISARDSYQHARKMFYMAFRDKFPAGPEGDRACTAHVNSLKLTQGAIRLEVELDTTNSVYTFGVTQQQPNYNNIVFPTERRLPLQDSICGTEIFMSVCKPASRTDINFQLRTYGNTVDFSAAAAAAINGTLYSNSGLKVTVNNDVILPYRPLLDFLYKPQTQQTAALGAGSPNDQFRGAEDAAATAEPNLVFIGSKNSEPQIILPGAMAAVDQYTRVVLIIRGPYAQNSTVVN